MAKMAEAGTCHDGKISTPDSYLSKMHAAIWGTTHCSQATPNLNHSRKLTHDITCQNHQGVAERLQKKIRYIFGDTGSYGTRLPELEELEFVVPLLQINPVARVMAFILQVGGKLSLLVLCCSNP